MTGIIILLIAFFLNIYVCYLVIVHNKKKTKEKSDLKFKQECQKFLVHLTEGFGMNYYDAVEEFKKIQTYPDLVNRNVEMEWMIKKYNL